MKKIDKTVLHETAFVGVGIVLLSIVMQVVFAVLGFWNVKVLYGNLLSGTIALCNFFLMGITVQLAMKKSGKEIENLIRISMFLRTAFLFVVALIGVLLPYFNIVTVFVPLFFPRIVIMLRPVFMKKEQAVANMHDEPSSQIFEENSEVSAESAESVKESDTE